MLDLSTFRRKGQAEFCIPILAQNVKYLGRIGLFVACRDKNNAVQEFRRKHVVSRRLLCKETLQIMFC